MRGRYRTPPLERWAGVAALVLGLAALGPLLCSHPPVPPRPLFPHTTTVTAEVTR